MQNGYRPMYQQITGMENGCSARYIHRTRMYYANIPWLSSCFKQPSIFQARFRFCIFQSFCSVANFPPLHFQLLRKLPICDAACFRVDCRGKSNVICCCWSRELWSLLYSRVLHVKRPRISYKASWAMDADRWLITRVVRRLRVGS